MKSSDYENLTAIRRTFFKIGSCIEKYERNHENYNALRVKLDECRNVVEDIYNGAMTIQEKSQMKTSLDVGLLFNGLVTMSCDESIHEWMNELDAHCVAVINKMESDVLEDRKAG